MWLLKTGDPLIEVTIYSGLTVLNNSLVNLIMSFKMSLLYLSVTISIGICVPATQNVINTNNMRNGSKVWHVDLHGPLVAIGDIITSDDMWLPRIQEQPVKF